MSSPWTTISPSMAITGAGGWFVVVGPGAETVDELVRAEHAEAFGAPVREDVESKAGRRELLVEVAAASARPRPGCALRCPARTSPRHHEGAAHCSAVRPLHVRPCPPARHGCASRSPRSSSGLLCSASGRQSGPTAPPVETTARRSEVVVPAPGVVGDCIGGEAAVHRRTRVLSPSGTSRISTCGGPGWDRMVRARPSRR